MENFCYFVCFTLFLCCSIYFVNGKCLPMWFDSDSIICMCNSTYCDELPQITPITKGKFNLYTSTASGLRFQRQSGHFSSETSCLQANITIDTLLLNLKDEIIGFGGSITDSAGLNINTLSENARNKLIEAYYSSKGIEYNMGRIPMGATDFSKGPYSYAEVPEDDQLEYFALKNFEDYELKIPILRKAQQLNPQLNLIASPWTCPFWMKSNDNYAFMGVLKHKYYQTYADYYIKFLEKYSEAGVKVWGITTGNEPWNGFWPFPLPILGWFMSDVTRWVRKNLGPTIRNSTRFNQTKIIIHDDQKMFLPRLTKFFKDDEALSYVDGVGVHWYLNQITPKSFLNFAKTPKKHLFILGTEATNGFMQFPAVELGSWSRAERYTDDIFDDLEYGAAGWIDWNIALNMYGGPVYTHFHADSTIIINAEADEFYKQPTYYIMGHFSKFLVRGSLRISVQTVLGNRNIRVLVYKRPDKSVVVIIYNKSNANFNLRINDLVNGCAMVKIRAKSINSLIYS